MALEYYGPFFRRYPAELAEYTTLHGGRTSGLRGGGRARGRAGAADAPRESRGDERAIARRLAERPIGLHRVTMLLAALVVYVQADAKTVYDVLFRDPLDKPPDDDDGGVRHEFGCLAHCRRKFWEAAIAKNVVAREALVRLGRIFELDATWRGRSPAEIKRLRDTHLRPHMQAFFAWAELEFDKVKQ